MASTRLARRVAGQFAELWREARPQAEGSYCPKFRLEEHVIDFRAPVESILRHIRAFGANGSLASIGMAWHTVQRAVGWSETHDRAPGEVAHVFNRSIVVAASDGYVGLLDCEPTPFAVVAEMPPGMHNRLR
jgi:methionyl-tRNA formyltransferase